MKTGADPGQTLIPTHTGDQDGDLEGRIHPDRVDRDGTRADLADPVDLRRPDRVDRVPVALDRTPAAN